MKKKFSRIVGVGVTLALLTSLMVGAAPATADISSATVVVAPTTITTPAVYTVTFDLNLALLPGTITVVFPTGTNVAAITPADVTVGSTSGIGQPALVSGNPAAVVPAAGPPPSLTITPQDFIGAGARVQMVIGNLAGNAVVNAGAVRADYTLSVFTSAEPNPVPSGTYALTEPFIPAVPGVVRGFNADAVRLFEDTGDDVISRAIATAGVVRVEVGPGTYDETAGNPTADGIIHIPAGVTVVSTDGAATTLISNANFDGFGGSVALDGAAAVLDGFTVTGGVTANANVTVQNCTLSNAAGPALNVAGGTGATTPAVSNANVISAATGFSGITVAAAQVASSSADTITVAAGGTGIVNNGTLTLTGDISGAGIGINSTGTLTVTGSSLSNLGTGITIGGGTVSVSTSTITACGSATVPTPAIDVTAAVTSVTIINNTIADSPDEVLQVAAAASGTVFMNFNTITNAAKGVDGTTAALPVDAANNLWDGGVAPPASVNATTSPYLTGAVSNQTIAPAAATIGSATLGVVAADSLGANWANAGVAVYDANPGTTAVPAEAFKYFDVYVNTPTNNINLTFYGVTSTTQLYAWSAGQSIWVPVAAAYDQFQGVLTFTVTNTSTPSLANLAGLPFALAEPAAPAPVLAIAQGSLLPELGAVDVTTKPNFTWAAAPSADHYEFAIAEDLGAANKFALLDYAAIETLNGHVAKWDLKYSTTYFWRVRAVAADDTKGAWAESFFTTEAEPEEVAPPVVVEEAPPQPDIILKSPDVTVQVPPSPPPVQIIPDYLLWVIIAVGAVLIIAVIVLIVRTRRVA